MLKDYIQNLEHSIVWAQHEDDFDVLCLAKQNMDQLMDFVSELSVDDQQRAHRRINQVLPMEWPLWMEACRYGDFEMREMAGTTYH
jgi:hypothetical protein